MRGTSRDHGFMILLGAELKLINGTISVVTVSEEIPVVSRGESCDSLCDECMPRSVASVWLVTYYKALTSTRSVLD